MFAPELLQRVGPESRGGGIGKEVAPFREFGVARFQFRHGLAHALGIFDFEGDEAVPPLEIRVAEQRVEGGKVAREFRIAAACNVSPFFFTSKMLARLFWPIANAIVVRQRNTPVAGS
jgi:hypothetical protein